MSEARVGRKIPLAKSGCWLHDHSGEVVCGPLVLTQQHQQVETGEQHSTIALDALAAHAIRNDNGNVLSA